MLEGFNADNVRELQERAIERKFNDEFHQVQIRIADAARNGGNYISMNLSAYVSRFRIMQEMKRLGFSVAAPDIQHVTFGW